MSNDSSTTTTTTTTTKGDELVRYARASIAEALGGPKAEPPKGALADDKLAAFVTLRWKSDGRLQGCIGNLDPRAPLASEIHHHSIAAATRDPRADPVTLDMVDELDVELSILSALEPVPFKTEQEALAAIEPDRHGVVFSYRGRRATFLPSMWDRLGDVKTFMSALKEKAGFEPDFWNDEVRVERYTVDKHFDPPKRSERGGVETK